MSDKLATAVATVSELLDRITSVFNPGVKVTLLVRRPGYDDQDFMLSDDVPGEGIAMIHRRCKIVRCEHCGAPSNVQTRLCAPPFDVRPHAFTGNHPADRR